MDCINSFPLYDTLMKDVDTCKNRVNKKTLIQNLNNIDDKHRETIYLIIKIFSLKNEKVSNVFELPYKGISTESEMTSSKESLQDLQFDLNNFPAKLIKSLDIFCKRYISN